MGSDCTRAGQTAVGASGGTRRSASRPFRAGGHLRLVIPASSRWLGGNSQSLGNPERPFVTCHQVMDIRQQENSNWENTGVQLQSRDLPDCLHHFVFAQADRNPNAVAILAAGRNPLTYGRLRRQIEQVLQELSTRGFGMHDRIAMVLPEGPEMAVAFVAIAAGATCAPLNPAYRTREFNSCLKDLNATALLLLSGSKSPQRQWPDLEASLFLN